MNSRLVVWANAGSSGVVIRVKYKPIHDAVVECLYRAQQPATWVAIRALSEVFKQDLRRAQIGSVESLGEPSVNGPKQVAGFLLSALTLPHSGKARRRAKLPRFRLLAARDFQGPGIRALRLPDIVWWGPPSGFAGKPSDGLREKLVPITAVPAQRGISGL